MFQRSNKPKDQTQTRRRRFEVQWVKLFKRSLSDSLNRVGGGGEFSRNSYKKNGGLRLYIYIYIYIYILSVVWLRECFFSFSMWKIK